MNSKSYNFGILFVTTLFFLFSISIYSQDHKWTAGSHKNIPGVSEKNRTMSVFIPKAYNGKDLLPILWLFSPNGNPRLDYTAWAEKNNVIMVAINSSRNGPSDNNIKAQDEALKTAKSMGLVYNQSLQMAQGMSGAAQSSWLFSIRFPKNFIGLVMCGQRGFDELPGKHTAVAYIRGEKEPNTPYIKSNYDRLKSRKNPVKLNIVPGGHVAGPKELREEMLSWVLFTGLLSSPYRDAKTIASAKLLVKQKLSEFEKIGDAKNKAKEYLGLYEILKGIKAEAATAKTIYGLYFEAMYTNTESEDDKFVKHENLMDLYVDANLKNYSKTKQKIYAALRLLWKDREVYKEYNAYNNLMKIRKTDTPKKRSSDRNKASLKKKYEKFIKDNKELRVIKKAEEFMKGL